MAQQDTEEKSLIFASYEFLALIHEQKQRNDCIFKMTKLEHP
jgi:hypothetical protein